MNTKTVQDSHSQLRALYQQLLSHQERFDEFKRILSLYETRPGEDETEDARDVRDRLNLRIREWIEGEFDGLSVVQMLQWRAIVVDERLNVALSPWKESNYY